MVRRLLATLNSFSAAWPLALATIAVWLFWAPHEGGFSELGWGLLGLGLVLLLAVGVLTIGWRALPIGSFRGLALGALGGFAAWNYLSIMWADFPADALVGSDKALVYAATFAIFVLWRWSSTGIATVLGLFVLGTSVLGIVVLTRTALGADAGAQFADGRLVPPIGYVNANTALWMLAFWPAVFLGSTHRSPLLLRPIFLAAAALLLELSVLGESRAWLLVLPAVALLFLLLSPERLRRSLALIVIAGAALFAIRPLLEVYDQASAGRPPDAALDRAARAVLVSCVLVAVAGALWAALDARLTLRRTTVRALGITTVIGAVIAIVAGGAFAAARVDDPHAWVSSHWHDLTCRSCESAGGTSRLVGGLGANRYREWEVAWDEFVAHPVTGIGSDNYAAAYLLRRTDPLFQPQYPHSTPMRLLSQLGLVGTGLFTVAIVSALLAALRERPRRDSLGAGGIAAAVCTFAVWLLHGSVDWFWEIPALAGPAFGALGLAASRPGPGSNVAAAGTEVETPRLVSRRRVFTGAGAVLLVAAAAALLFPWLSARYESAGADVWIEQPTQAYRDLERAAELNPLSAEPLLVEGSIALRRSDRPRARSALGRALRREPKNWFGHFQLALLDASSGRFGAASQGVRRARKLNPQDPVVAILDRLVRRRAKIDPVALDSLYVRDVERRLRGTGSSLSA